MIRKDHFLKLHLKKQIYKITEQLRMLVPAEGAANLKAARDLAGYSEYMKDSDHPKIIEARRLVEELLRTLPEGYENSPLPRGFLEKANMTFHALMGLINEEPDESRYKPFQKRFDRTGKPARFPHAAILDNLRSPFNVGSIFRSCDCFGVGTLALCGITPCPPMPKLERTAMGAIEATDWRYYKTTAEAAEHYRSLGYRIIGVETVEGAEDLYNAMWPEKSVFIFGNEEFGMMEESLALCDGFIEIPMAGVKNSLNVAGSFAVVMAEAMRRRGQY